MLHHSQYNAPETPNHSRDEEILVDFQSYIQLTLHPREFSPKIQWKHWQIPNERALGSVNKCKMKSIELNIWITNNWTYIMHLDCIYVHWELFWIGKLFGGPLLSVMWCNRYRSLTYSYIFICSGAIKNDCIQSGSCNDPWECGISASFTRTTISIHSPLLPKVNWDNEIEHVRIKNDAKNWSVSVSN